MARPKGGLGRGLDALIGTAATDVLAASTLQVPIDSVLPNPRQPRQSTDDARLDELADSIREHGVLQPLLVALAPQPGRYQLIAGERRWQAAKRAGLETVPVVIKEATPQQLIELALVENIQRADLNPLEEAAAYRHLVEEFGLRQEEVARRVGRSRFTVANTLRLLQLDPEVQRQVLAGELSEGHARALLSIEDAGLQRRLANRIVEQGLSVRATEELVRRLRGGAPPPVRVRRGRPVHTETAELEEQFRRALGTKVELSRSRRGGRLIIHYFSDEQLQAIYDSLVRPVHAS